MTISRRDLFAGTAAAAVSATPGLAASNAPPPPRSFDLRQIEKYVRLARRAEEGRDSVTLFIATGMIEMHAGAIKRSTRHMAPGPSIPLVRLAPKA